MGNGSEDKIGEAISLNGDGTIIAIGAPYSVGDDIIDNVRIHTLVLSRRLYQSTIC